MCKQIINIINHVQEIINIRLDRNTWKIKIAYVK